MMLKINEYKNISFKLISISVLIFMILTTGCKREKHYKKEYLANNNSNNSRIKKSRTHFGRRKVEIDSKPHMVKKEKVEESKPKSLPSGNGAVYAIKPGDSLWKVSRMFHIPISYLVDYNGIEVDSPLKVGQEILIPSSLNAIPPHRRKKTGRTTVTKTKKTRSHKRTIGRRPKKSKYPWPLKGDILRRFSNNFKGIDISSSKTSFVKAVSDGEVIFADNMEGYGKLVIIDNLNGMFFIYGQLRTILLNNGDTVKRGQKVGRGGTPNVSGQTRIYFEIRKAPSPGADPKAVNPLRYLK